MNFLKSFLTRNEWQFRLARTLLQAAISFLVGNIDVIVETLEFSPTTKITISALVMILLSPVMAELGKYVTTEADNCTEEIEYEDNEEEVEG